MTKTTDKSPKPFSLDIGPGPAGVVLPPTLGFKNHDFTRTRNPAYSFGLKTGGDLVQKGSPGPVYRIPDGLTAKGPKDSPAYSLRPRTGIIGDFKTITPGPAAYLPNINANRTRAPTAPLSSRSAIIDGSFSPGPIYMVPSNFGKKGVSITGKGKGEEQIFRSPGPVYNIGKPNIIKNSAPAYSIKGRWSPLKLQPWNAGPGSYGAPKYKIGLRPPAYSFGIRHSIFAGNYMPKIDRDLCSIPVVEDDDVC